MAKIIIPTPLRKFTSNNSSYTSTAPTVGAAIEELSSTYPDIQKHLYDGEGKIRSFIKVFVGDEDIRHMEQENTGVQEDTIISIVPAIAGGSIA